MQTKQHKNARTTLAIRQEIRESSLSAYALSKQYRISWSTAKHWKEAAAVEDRSSRPHRLRTALTTMEKRLKSLSYKTPAQYLKETKNTILQRIVI